VASTRAAWLAQARLLPLACAAVLVPVQIVAFARFEAGGDESPGPLLILTASIGAALLIDGVLAGVKSWRETRTLVAGWRITAAPLAVPTWTRQAWSIRRSFPVVALVGIVRPQLFIAARVASHCTSDELAGIAAHEAAHVRAQDNLLRFLYRATPGARLASRVAVPLEQAWLAAAEEAADARARLTTSNVELASALTKVARMAAGLTPEVLQISRLIGDSPLDSRVRSLLDPPVRRRRFELGWLPSVMLIASAAAVLSSPILALIHELFELLVRR
jgi:hypothetical protein